MKGCVINSSPNLDKFTFSLAPMTYYNYCVIQLLKSQQQQQQEYPILGPLSLRIAVKNSIKNTYPYKEKSKNKLFDCFNIVRLYLVMHFQNFRVLWISKEQNLKTVIALDWIEIIGSFKKQNSSILPH